jgi:hypothetical protein
MTIFAQFSGRRLLGFRSSVRALGVIWLNLRLRSLAAWMRLWLGRPPVVMGGGLGSPPAWCLRADRGLPACARHVLATDCAAVIVPIPLASLQLVGGHRK